MCELKRTSTALDNYAFPFNMGLPEIFSQAYRQPMLCALIFLTLASRESCQIVIATLRSLLLY